MEIRVLFLFVLMVNEISCFYVVVRASQLFGIREWNYQLV